MSPPIVRIARDRLSGDQWSYLPEFASCSKLEREPPPQEWRSHRRLYVIVHWHVSRNVCGGRGES
jgi:hypothetical protein